jgi:hypothetical protein
MAKYVSDEVSPKTSEEALDFVRNLQKAFPKTPRTKKELAALRKYLARFSDAELRAVGRRVMSDLMHRPARTVTEGDLPPMPVTPPKPRGDTPSSGGSKGPKPRPGRTRKPSTAPRPRRGRGRSAR